jgi:hypothetical protein
MTMNTPYLGTPSASTTVFSDVSVSGTADLGVVQATGAVALDSSLNVTGAATLGQVQANSAVTVSTLAVGSGLGNLSIVSTSLQSIAALTVNDLESNQTTFTDNFAALGDIVFATPLDSDLSNGLAYNAYVSAASTVALRYSNCSATEAKPIAQTWRFAIARFS